MTLVAGHLGVPAAVLIYLLGNLILIVERP